MFKFLVWLSIKILQFHIMGALVISIKKDVENLKKCLTSG